MANLKQLYQKKILDSNLSSKPADQLKLMATSPEINKMLDVFKEYEIDRAYELAMATFNSKQKTTSGSSSEDESSERNLSRRRRKENKSSKAASGDNEQVFIFDEVQDILEEGSHGQGPNHG